MTASLQTEQEMKSHPAEPAVVLLAPVGRDAQLAAAMLGKAGIKVDICRSSSELLERIATDNCGPLVITDEALGRREAERLEEVLRDQPVWSDLPLVLCNSETGTSRKVAKIAKRSNTILLARPFSIVTFITTVRTAIKDRQRQYAVRDLVRNLQIHSRELQQLTLQLSEAEEREKDRLAMILHDDLQQLLAGVAFRLEFLYNRIEDKKLQHLVEDLRSIMEQAIEKTRSLSHELSPPTLRQHGLAAALAWQAERVERMHGMQVAFDCRGEVDSSDMRLKFFIFRAAQELLFNVTKHAGVDQASLRLSGHKGGIELCVQDEGRGFNPAVVEHPDTPKGMGVLSIKERVNLLGGRLSIISAPEKGCTVRLFLPRQAYSFRNAAMPEAASGLSREIHQESRKSPETREVRVLLADDHHVVRHGLRALLNDQPGVRVIDEAKNGVQAVKLAATLSPDVILMDVSMPVMDGIEATRRIKAAQPDIRIIGLSMHNDKETEYRMFQAGVDDYLSKTECGDRLMKAIRAGHRG